MKTETEIQGEALLNQITMSTVMNMSPTTTTDLGECNRTAELGALPDINNAATAAAERVEKDEVMKDANTQNGNIRLGVKVQNIATLPNSSAQHVRAVGDLKVGRFVFKGVTFSREEGKEAVVKLPWETQMVSIPDGDDLTKVNQEVHKQINQAADGLKQVTASTGLWS